MKHLKAANMTYFQHMRRALWLSFRFGLASIFMLIHAIIPELFTGWATKTVTDIYENIIEKNK